MALEPDQIPEAVDDFIHHHAAKPPEATPVPHAATPAHLAAVEAYRTLGRHIVAMGDLVLRDPWGDVELAAMDRDVRRLSSEIDPAMERMRLLRECHGAMH